MHIAIDVSRAGVAERTGTERYSFELIGALAQVDRRSRYTLFSNGLPATLPPLGPNFALRSVPLPRLWTHLALGPAAMLARPEVLFVPAHVVPLVHPRSVVTIHDLGYLAFPEAHTARRRLELHVTTLWSVRAARRVIAISGATKAALLRQYRADPAKVAVVHHGVSPAFRSPTPEAVAAARARHGLNEPYFLYVGTLQPRKNLERLIVAFATATAALPEPRPLLAIGGRRGWLADTIERTAAELGAAGRVRLLGYLPEADLPPLLGGAVAFVFPSLYEGFGMPVLEAMGCGTPVLTSNSSALPEVAGEAALLVEPTDEGAIGAAIARLAEDEQLRGALRARGLARAAQYSWERCARETLAVLREAAGP